MEHLIKGSDLRNDFGEVSQTKPLYFHTDQKKNIPIKSIKKSQRLKSDAPMCNYCNSNRTQPFDRAWENLSSYFSKNWEQIKHDKSFNLTSVFPGSEKKSLLDVHLYFVKLFGCRIVEDKIPINIKEFSDSLCKTIAHKNIYLAIGSKPVLLKTPYAGISPIEALKQNNKIVFASWFYIVGQFAVQLFYSTVPNNDNALRNTWQPNIESNILNLAEFET